MLGRSIAGPKWSEKDLFGKEEMRRRWRKRSLQHLFKGVQQGARLALPD